MITLTALNNLRCSIRPELIVAVEAGSSTVVLLSTGVRLAVKESAEEVRRLMEAATPAVGARPGVA
jgi:uncharacterized protein YlzI (FlbEa/FlbD family)